MEDNTLTIRHCVCARVRMHDSKKARRGPGCIRSLASCLSSVNLLWTGIYLLFMLLLNINLSYGNPVRFMPETPRFKLSDVTTFQGRAQDGSQIQYYRHLMIVGDKLYAGAMNYLIELNTKNISLNYKISKNISTQLVKDNHERCTQLRKSADFECQNHIRAIIPIDNTLEVCGTAAYYPMKFTFDRSDISGSFDEGRSDRARAWCSRDPEDSCTSLHVHDRNFGNSITMYSGSIMDFARSDPVIYRPQLEGYSDLLRSDRQDKWLNKPTFIKSFDVGDYVYFFLRENAIEYTNCGKAIYSRVARICKNDKGGSPRVLQNRWTTYMKARLNCSMPGEYPFYFNELYDVFNTSDNKFYGIFTTNLNGMYGSAVCSFTNLAIESAFNGSFKEQPGPNSNWIKVPESQVPVPRPGQCTPNSPSTSDKSLQFIKAHPLMDEAVHSETGVPLFYQQETVFNKILVDRVNNYNVFFLATDKGAIHKVVTWTDTEGEIHSKTVTIWENFTNASGSPIIRQMKLHEDFVYVSTDDEVLQMSVKQCGRYEYCTQCIQDPYCGWDKHICTDQLQRTGVLQNVEAEHPEKVCDESCKHEPEHSHYIHIRGDPIHLNCSSRCEPSGDVTWHHDNGALTPDGKKRFLTRENSLIVFNVTQEDQGVYECRSQGVSLIKHQLTVNKCNGPESCWKEEFSKWCQEFENYKEELKHWQCLKNTCASSTDCKVDFSTCPAT